MSWRYLLIHGRRREGWEARLARLASLCGLEIALDRFPLAVLRGGRLSCLELPGGGAILGTLFLRHGAPRPLQALEAGDAAEIVASAGDVLLRTFWGGYVALLPEVGTHRLLRDPSGALPCYFVEGDDFTAFASGADLLVRCGLAVPAIDWDALGAHLLAPGLPRPWTVLRNISELLPGFGLRLSGHGRQVLWWNPWDHVAPHRGPEPATERLARAARLAVRGWASPFGRILLSVSGGLDSSVVAACLSGAGAEVTCATLHTEDPAGDERDYARCLAEALRLRLIERPYRLDQVDLSRAFAPQLPRPVGRIQAQAYDRTLVEILDAIGAQAFMTGNGGDNVFGYSQSAAAIADGWRVLGPGRRLAAVIADTCRLTGCGPLEAIAKARRLLRRPARYLWRSDERLLSRAVVAGCARPLDHEWLDASASALPGKAAHIAALLRAQHTLEPGRSASAPVLHPLLSQPLMETCLSIPSWAWREGGEDRAVARKAFAHVLPERILRRRVKGTPDAFSAEVIRACRPQLRDRLLSGHLAARGLVDIAAVEAALRPDLGRPAEDSLRILELAAAEAWVDHWVGGGAG